MKKMKQKTYTSTVWNPEKRVWASYEIPMPEYEPNYNVMSTETVTVASAFVICGFLFAKMLGVM